MITRFAVIRCSGGKAGALLVFESSGGAFS